MNCTALVSAHSVMIRARGTTDDPRCRRRATVNGMCAQHAAIRYCAAPGCSNKAVKQVGRFWFCKQHAPLWETHSRILQRIKDIPPRD